MARTLWFMGRNNKAFAPIIAGQRFSRLTTIRRDDSRGPKIYWVCRCECGVEKSVGATNLLGSRTKSCGCLLTDFLRGRSTHRATCAGTVDHRKHTPEYSAWSAIKNRCCSTSSQYYGRYGGRGIGLCDRWFSSFVNFLSDMGPRPSPLHSIDRIDNDGNYEPSNCRWATKIEQNRNRRSNLVLTAFGQSMPLAGWAEKTGIGRQTIRQRLRHGWTVEDALCIPARSYGRSSATIQTATPTAASAMVTATHNEGDDSATGAPTVL